MSNYGGKTEAPGQVTSPSDASKGYSTAKTGKIYPEEKSQGVREYIDNEGSQGFMRNQGAVRDQLSAPTAEVMAMGQHKRLKDTGSHGI